VILDDSYAEFSWTTCPIPGSTSPSEAHVVNVVAGNPNGPPTAVDISRQGEQFYHAIANVLLGSPEHHAPDTLRILRSELYFVRASLERFLHPSVLQTSLLQANLDAVDASDYEGLVAMTLLTRHAAELLHAEIEQATR
jgi:hypothetical protein